ncbi:hypothetical protein A1O3_07972 [Capronia epimyces CBS 606.96]|uniref:WSC domain-containing protein n=1 Tax=Capronia epimyces CBS 606.96 TaxID=1182542 RepID=W9XRS3_9EURO|nr:uncharacterized protein A1O3_07972 [Capronia epimyces CBS 606.96]EXJ79691.1 hypothetical protein A1O3_07972 [Capronia epimyces CBS 606.96]
MLTTVGNHPHRPSFLPWVVIILLLSTRSRGLDISYCSPQNNAGSYPEYYNLYQSNGACQVHCQGSYAFAILQGYDCWCSNYVPTEQESTSNCDQQCPGYGSEWCGSTEAGLYGYYLLSDGVPLGTSGGSAISTAVSTATATASPSVSTSLTQSESGSPSPTPDMRTTSPSSPSSTVDEASSGTGYSDDPSTASTSPSTHSVTSSTTSTSSDSSTTPPSSSPTPTPTAVYTSVTTITGEVRTVVITPSPSVDATLGQSATGGGGGVSTGKVVGIVLGVALGLGALIGIGAWLWFRRRHRKLQMQGGPDTTFIPRTGVNSSSNNIPSRQVSQLSSSGLLGNKTPRLNTSGMSLGNDPRSADTASTGVDRRSLATDQRLNPYALYIHDESRLSNVSLQDNQDYSRQLRVSGASCLAR